jgi:hypothetical protein
MIAAALVFNGWWLVSYGWETQQSFSRVGLSYGRLYIKHFWKVHSWDDYPNRAQAEHLPPGWDWWHRTQPGLPEPIPTLKQGPGYFRMALPLCVPFLVLLIPTLLLWRRERRKLRPGFCRVCDYDLTGNTTGRCPECGTPYDRASEKALPPAA